MKKIKGVFFDIGYTLCCPVSNDWRLTKKFYSYIDLNDYSRLSKVKIEYAINESKRFLDEHHLLFTLDEEYRQNIEAYKIIADCLPELNLSYEMIKDIAYDRTYNMKNYSFYDGVKEVFQSLTIKYKLGIISDTWPSADNMLHSAEIYEYIDSFIYSCNLGVCKPDPIMFSKAVQEMDIDPGNTVFIDDSEENLEVADSFGIHPIMILTRSDKSKNGYPTINHISELEEVIDQYL